MRRVLTTLKWLVIGGIVILVLQLNPFYRLSYTVNTYDGWCRQLLGGNHPGFVIGFDHKAIRDDFVNTLNDLVVSSATRDYLGGAKRNDKVVRELERLKMIGVWAEGNTLYMANGLLVKDTELGIDEFDEWHRQFAQNLDLRRNAKDEEYSHWRKDISDAQYCMVATLDDHFAKCVLVGPRGRSVSIPLRFMWKKEFSDADKTSPR